MFNFFSHSSSSGRKPNPNQAVDFFQNGGLFGVFRGSSSSDRRRRKGQYQRGYHPNIPPQVGYPNVPPQQGYPQNLQQPYSASSTVCSKCGASVPAGSKFCLSCGAPINTAALCQNCGKPLPPNAKFCPECGTPRR